MPKLLFRFLLLLGASLAIPAWDAGPASCKHDACTGGVNANTFADTQPKYAASQLPRTSCPTGTDFYGGLCYSSCPANWSRSAVCTCKGPGVFDLWTDCGKFGSSTLPASSCPAGTDAYGGLCYSGCPAGSVRTAVSTCVHSVKWRSNTHLYVVAGAIDLLSRVPNDPVAAKAVAKMRDAACRERWESGLWDADDADLSETGGSRGSHFYNGAGLDFWGAATKVITYLMSPLQNQGAGSFIEQNSKGNARTNAQQRMALAAAMNTADHCYQLGIALHYMSDMTQPMHAASFSAVDIPTSLHAVFEDYVGNIQGRFPAASVNWDGRFKGRRHDEVFHEAAVRANSFAPGLSGLLKYEGTICTMMSEPPTSTSPMVAYTGRCFVHEPAVDNKAGELLKDAYQSIASYLYAAFSELNSKGKIS